MTLHHPMTLIQNQHHLIDKIVNNYYEDLAFNLPLNATNISAPQLADRYNYINKMYVGVNSPIGYVLGNVVPHVSGMTYALTGAFAAKLAISATGEITLADNTGLTAGNYVVNYVHNLLGTIPITIPVVSAASNIAFYDSVNGNDSNSGKEPHLPKLTWAYVSPCNTWCARRGSDFTGVIEYYNNRVYSEYGNPIADDPKMRALPTEQYVARPHYKTDGVPASGFQSSSGWTLEGFELIGDSVNTIRVVHCYNQSNFSIKRNKISGSADNVSANGIYLSLCTGVTIRHNEISGAYYGDGIYGTTTSNAYVEWNTVRPPRGGVADCIQFSDEGNFAQIPYNTIVRWNIIDYGVNASSSKGALVYDGPQKALAENNFIKGGYFAIGSGYVRGTARGNQCFWNRLVPTVNNEWGLGIGLNKPAYDQKYYCNVVNSGNRAYTLSGYEPPAGGWPRSDITTYYNTLFNCNESGKATEPISGEYTDNVIVNNITQGFLRVDRGANTASTIGTCTITQTAGVATAVCDKTHNLTIGDTVTIANAGQAQYNGTFTVTGVTSYTVFQYAVDSGAPSPATGTISFTKIQEYNSNLISNLEQAYLGSIINVAPTITGNCQDGQTVTCNVTAQAGITYSYQWLLMGRKISGATSASYTIPAATSALRDRFMPDIDGLNIAQLGCAVIATDARGMVSYTNGLWDRFTLFKTVAA